MNIRCGTSGYSYGEWKGTFYPEDLPAGEMLRFYAARLPAVEINSTFYRQPRASVLESWAGQVGPEFRFVLKAPRRITHVKRLRDAEEDTGYLLRTASVLGERLGAILFQLPPNLKKDIGRLDAFLGLLGDPGRTAFEFRHPSWHDEETFACLRARGAALCCADTEEQDVAVVSTAPLGYFRLRKEGYTEGELRSLALRIAEPEWERAFVFFKHEDDGAGARMARRLTELLRSGL